MKTTTTIVALAIASVSFIACGRKDNSPAPAPTPNLPQTMLPAPTAVPTMVPQANLSSEGPTFYTQSGIQPDMLIVRVPVQNGQLVSQAADVRAFATQQIPGNINSIDSLWQIGQRVSVQLANAAQPQMGSQYPNGQYLPQNPYQQYPQNQQYPQLSPDAMQPNRNPGYWGTQRGGQSIGRMGGNQAQFASLFSSFTSSAQWSSLRPNVASSNSQQALGLSYANAAQGNNSVYFVYRPQGAAAAVNSYGNQMPVNNQQYGFVN